MNDEIKQQPTETEKLQKQMKRKERSVKSYEFFALRLAVFVLALWVLFFWVVGVTRMPGNDMYPRLDLGDMVLYYRLDKDVQSEDVIVIYKATPDSGGDKLMYISRVIGAPGDTVEITENGGVKVNGNVLIESNIFYNTPRYQGNVEYPLTLGEDECFVLADSRQSGTDSRYFGPVSRDEILGTVITVVRRNNL